MLSAIFKEIRKSRGFSILADVATEISNKELLSLVLRFLVKFSLILEKFLGCLHSRSTSEGALANLISDHMKELDLDIGNCRVQSYDGAGKDLGVKAKFDNTKC